MVHPDKLRDMENAREAFEQVKTAYQKLQDEKQRGVVVLNIEYILEEFNKERRRLISKGVSVYIYYMHQTCLLLFIVYFL
jgi:thymidylate kinase